MSRISRSPAPWGLALAALWLAIPSSGTAQQFDEDIYGSLEWTNVGPLRGGRSTAVAGSDARPNEYFFGATGGGTITMTATILLLPHE